MLAALYLPLSPSSHHQPTWSHSAIDDSNRSFTVRGFGIADKASQRPVTSSTLFALGSVTTVFTSTLLGMLMDESKRFTPDEPGVGIVTSADDMAKWLSFHMRKGVTADGVPLLKKETLEETYKLQMALPEHWSYVRKPKDPVTFSVFGCGFSWYLSNYRGYQVEWMAGPVHSYHSFLALIRDVDLGIYISTTALFDSNGATLYEIFYIVDLLLGEDPWRNITTLPEFFLAPKQKATNPTDTPFVAPDLVENPQLFEGTYGHRLFGNVSISREASGELLVSYNRILGKLRKTNETHVLLADIYGTLEFATHRGDNVWYVTMTFTSPGEGGQYQSLLVRINDDPLLFQRNVT